MKVIKGDVKIELSMSEAQELRDFIYNNDGEHYGITAEIYKAIGGN